MVQIAEKAKEDAENDNYNPPHGRWPGRYGVGIEARDGYDRAFNLHHSDDDAYQAASVGGVVHFIKSGGRGRRPWAFRVFGPFLLKILKIFKFGGTIDLASSWS